MKLPLETKKWTDKDLENACIYFCDVFINSPSEFKDKDGKDKDLRQIWNENMKVSVYNEVNRKARKRLEEEIEKFK